MKKRVLFAAPLCALAVLSAVAWMAFAATGGSTPDPYRNFKFIVLIDGASAGGFTEVSGLSLEQEVTEYRSGNDRLIRKIPGLHKTGDVTLKRGVIRDSDMWDWINAAKDDPDYPRSEVKIELYGGGSPDPLEPLVSWELHECFPSRWELVEDEVGPGQRLILEAITVSCNTITRVDRDGR